MDTIIQNLLETLLEGDHGEAAYLARSLAEELEDGVDIDTEEILDAIRVVAAENEDC